MHTPGHHVTAVRTGHLEHVEMLLPGVYHINTVIAPALLADIMDITAYTHQTDLLIVRAALTDKGGFGLSSFENAMTRAHRAAHLQAVFKSVVSTKAHERHVHGFSLFLSHRALPVSAALVDNPGALKAPLFQIFGTDAEIEHAIVTKTKVEIWQRYPVKLQQLLPAQMMMVQPRQNPDDRHAERHPERLAELPYRTAQAEPYCQQEAA